MITVSMAASTATPQRLALALPAVAVAEGEQRALDVDPEVAGGAGPHLRGVHVAAVGVGDQRRAGLEGGRGDPDGAVHRVQRQVHGAGRRAGPGRSPSAGRGRPRRSRRPRAAGSCSRAVAWVAGERAEQRDGGGGGPVPRRLDRHEVDGQGVAGLGALDIERAGLRVDERELDHLGDQVVGPADPCRRRRPRSTARGPCPAATRRTGGDAAERPGELRRVRPVAETTSMCAPRVLRQARPRRRAPR